MSISVAAGPSDGEPDRWSREREGFHSWNTPVGLCGLIVASIHVFATTTVRLNWALMSEGLLPSVLKYMQRHTLALEKALYA